MTLAATNPAAIMAGIAGDPPPFPIEALPPVVARFVTEGGETRGIPCEFISVPLLGFASAVIGDRITLTVKRGWCERAALWTASIGGPGTGKSPGIDAAREPLDAIQSALWAEYQQARAVAGSNEGTGSRGSAPRLTSVYTTDATLEAVASMLETGRGLAIVRDELASWTASFDQYRKGGDRQTWLAMWSGAPLKVDRKSATSVYVPSPVVSVIGGVQPDRLGDLRGSDVNDGFPDRFLLSWPVSRPIGWTDAEDDPRTVQVVADIFAHLHARWSGDPLSVVFSERAAAMFRRFVNDNACGIETATGLAAGWAAKAPRHCARLALVLHCLSNADEPDRPVSESTVDRAIALTEYFRSHFTRCLPAMGTYGTSRSAGDDGRILRLLRQASGGDGWQSRAELMQGTRLSATRLRETLERLRTSGDVESRVVATATNRRQDWRAITDGGGQVVSENSSFSEDSHSDDREIEFPESFEYSEGTPDQLNGRSAASAIGSSR